MWNLRFPLAFSAAMCLEKWFLVRCLPVLTRYVSSGVEGVRAEASVVLQKALVAAVKAERKVGDGGVGNGFKGGADRPVDGVDFADEGDADLAVKGGDEVGEATL